MDHEAIANCMIITEWRRSRIAMNSVNC